ncbi:hypothetical protein [Treponema sp. R80B11-R83G3]
MKSLKRFLSVVLLSFLLVVQLFANPRQIANAADFFLSYGNPSIFKTRTIDIVKFGNGGGGGVLFRAIAVPEDNNLLKQQIILTYNYEKGNDGSRLKVSFGGKTIIVNDLYDWMLLPVAAFADTPYYNCVTLLADPVETSEINRRLFAIDQEKKVYFAEYHPAFINTLIGFNLLLVDAIFIDPNVRNIPYKAKELINLKGYNTNDNQAFKLTESNSSLDYIKKILLDEKGKQKHNNYVFSDPDNGISFKIENNKINFTAVPYYHFLLNKSKTRRFQFEYIKELTESIQDSKQVKNISPAIFDCAEKIAQWAAFFRMVKYQFPDAWYDFISQIKPKLTDARYIPGLGPENDKYQYKFDSEDFNFETPRSLDFIGKEKEEEFKKFVNESETIRSILLLLNNLNSEQQKRYSSLSLIEQIYYLSLSEEKREIADRLSQKSLSVFLSLSSNNDELNTYLRFDLKQRELFDNLSKLKRSDLLSLSKEKRETFFTLNPVQQEICFEYDDAKRNEFLSLSPADRHKYILKDDEEMNRLISTKQYDKFKSLTEDQKEIYFSISNPYERNVYLSFNNEQRKYCDGLSVTDRNNFLSLAPKERDRVMDEVFAPRVIGRKIEPALEIIMPEKQIALTPKQFDIYLALTPKQREIYSTLITPKQQLIYLSLTSREREYCDNLRPDMRTLFLSLEPEQRINMILGVPSIKRPKRTLQPYILDGPIHTQE